ncbi:UvrD-helicase domain-containing protein [candidate division KSB1 bacterium]|nr:UvrD-helicase domain-containing protein [candidate division KSB1 bacterium]
MSNRVSKNASSEDWLVTDLNSEQSAAVSCTEGPVLILAGAGSGKTRVLTYRIAYLLQNGLAEASEILAMTFTNKAAGEMRERVAKLVPNRMSGMWIGTFHSLFARLMRREGERLGYSSNFTIYDESDQIALLKKVLSDMHLSVQDFPPKMVSFRISAAKNRLLLPDHLLEEAENQLDTVVANVYRNYQNRLLELNAMDFDDLLIKPIELLQRFPLVAGYYQDKFRYILVDEYQDTNHAQYILLKILAAKHRNIAVVGDDDQSIYRWRGADIRNILDFEKDYPECKKFRLEQNYRSTRKILAAAHSVVKNNRQRHPKELWTDKPEGENVVLLEVESDLTEAHHVVARLIREFKGGQRNFYDFAVLYRTNAQSRVIEEALRRENVPYIIVGGVKFYERKEVKDVLAYLRFLSNQTDAISFRRAINYPARGIGDATADKIEDFARLQKLTLVEAMKRVQEIGSIQIRTREKIESFSKLVQKYASLKSELSPAELAAALVDEVGILRYLKEEGTIEAANRMENVRELLLAIAEFSSQNGRSATLDDYLQQVALTTDLDTLTDRTNAVTLMTLHSAKGLEFSVVFIVGLEEGLFPLSRSIQDPPALEEERRLFYVGATRAKEKLYLSWSRYRRRYGENLHSMPSRFIKELDPTTTDAESTLRPFRIERRRSAYHDSVDSPMPNYEDQTQENLEYRVGMRVAHEVFGKGTIVKIDPGGEHAKLLVMFDTAGKRRLVLPYAKLEIL